MLPFTKRTVRSEEASELINTGDIEVLPSAGRRPSAFPPPASDRPRVFARSTSDDEMTTLMPRKGMTFSSRPPAPVTPVPMPNMKPSSRPPRAMLEEPPTRQFVKPGAPPPSVSPVAGPSRASNRPPPSPMAHAHARAALKPQPVPVIAENLKSDPRLDPPATVITARTRIVAARPTMSWAAALVAMGVFVGLVTAVVARGDADTLIDAAASFVDPSGGHAAAAGVASLGNVQTKADDTRATLAAMVDTLSLPEADTKAVAANDLPSASAAPMPQRPAPVAYAAPVRHAAPAHVARPAVSHEERVAAYSAPKAAPPAPKAAPAPKASKATDDDMESASAADALARAQLEASLR